MPVFATQSGGVNDLQPFFETLMPFPPPEKYTPDFLKSSLKLEDYYISCNWDKIAETYADILVSALKPKL